MKVEPIEREMRNRFVTYIAVLRCLARAGQLTRGEMLIALFDCLPPYLNGEKEDTCRAYASFIEDCHTALSARDEKGEGYYYDSHPEFFILLLEDIARRRMLMEIDTVERAGVENTTASMLTYREFEGAERAARAVRVDQREMIARGLCKNN